jgi:hypothetical protein
MLATRRDPRAQLTRIVGAYRTSFKRILDAGLSLFGTVTYMSLLPIALKDLLSAAMIDFGVISTKLINHFRFPDMCLDAPESYKSMSMRLSPDLSVASIAESNEVV